MRRFIVRGMVVFLVTSTASFGIGQEKNNPVAEVSESQGPCRTVTLRKTKEGPVVIGLETITVSDAGMGRIGVLDQLEVLKIDHSNVLSVGRVTDEMLRHLSGLRRLKSLAILGAPMSGVGLKYIQGLPSLTTIELEFSEISDAGLVSIADMPQLETLDLGFTRITDEGLQQSDQAGSFATVVHWSYANRK